MSLNKILVVGDFKTGTGPANVTKEYLTRLGDKARCLKASSKAGRAAELLLKIPFSSVVFCSGYSAQNVLAAKIAHLFRKKCAYLMHGSVAHENRINLCEDEGMNRVEYDTLRLCDRVFAVSNRFAGWLKRRYPEFENKIDVLVNGVDIDVSLKRVSASEVSDTHFAESKAAPLKEISVAGTSDTHSEDSKATPLIGASVFGISDTNTSEAKLSCKAEKKGGNEASNKNRILSIGGGMPRKRINRICEAIELLRKEDGYDNLELIVTGDRGAFSEVISGYGFVKDLGIVSREETEKLYRQAGLFIQNSCFETFGLAPMEALSCGCDVLLSKEIGALELFDFKENEELSRYIIKDCEDPAEIAEKIKEGLGSGNADLFLRALDIDGATWEKKTKQLVQKLESL